MYLPTPKGIMSTGYDVAGSIELKLDELQRLHIV